MPQPNRIIAMLTDFGYRDPYVAAMKGVILSIDPQLTVIDITHEVPNFNVREAAFILFNVYRYYPRGTVFLVVVDPGVGSTRRAIAIETENYFFVGPDNGVLMLAARSDGIVRCVELTNDRFFRKPVSRSFHGRDIFAPCAAWIAKGIDLEALGPRIDCSSLTSLDMELDHTVRNGCVELRVLYIDRFGNVILSQYFDKISNAVGLRIGSRITVRNISKNVALEGRVCEVFSHARPGELVLYRDSFDLAELAVNLGSASKVLNADVGDLIEICLVER